MKKWILIATGALVSLFAVAYGVGALLPREHVVTVRAHYSQPPDSIYRVLTDVAAYPSWRPDIEAVERRSDRNSHTVWRERSRVGLLEFEFTVAIRPTRLVSTIVTADAGFSGRWIYQILPDPTGTTLSVTEEGTVDNPFFRFLMQFVFGKYASLESTLRSLGTRFGETARPTRVV